MYSIPVSRYNPSLHEADFHHFRLRAWKASRNSAPCRSSSPSSVTRHKQQAINANIKVYLVRMKKQNEKNLPAASKCSFGLCPLTLVRRPVRAYQSSLLLQVAHYKTNMYGQLDRKNKNKRLTCRVPMNICPHPCSLVARHSVSAYCSSLSTPVVYYIYKVTSQKESKLTRRGPNIYLGPVPPYCSVFAYSLQSSKVVY